MKVLSERTNHFTESVIRHMTRIANSCGAINLSQGFPDFDPPAKLQNRLAEVAHEGPHQYAITIGAKNFREAVCKKQEHFSGLRYDPEREIVITCGSTEAMMITMMSVCNPGDKVVIFSPFYENYTADTILAGATPIYVPLSPKDFSFDANVLEDAMKEPGVKALILCNPSNPSGKVFTRDELKIIADLAIKYDLYVITDEVYEHIVFAPSKHTYMATLPGMRERTIECSSLSKTYSITGWRLGYILAAEPIMERIKKVHDFTVVGAASPLQEVAVTAMNFGDEYYRDLQMHYTHMKTLFTDGLRNLGFKFSEPQGTYFVMMDISEFAKNGIIDDNKFCIDMAQKVGVAAVPGSSFFRENVNNLIRFHFAKKDETIIEALNRLENLKKK
ncbi:MAG: aminotransferase class I/II-fold pyridoxal phosphate-dependent enzyme [Hallerella sp.]|uniref:Aminotransferase n=1 Tax=Hallerella porci TaxID=1945871 RepID=A0ABX5LN65_9BACT|nr:MULTISPECIES: aminotransferase class I/II-fold pyridoxal phosphate-dependent enzyme [Hallerella]MCI5601019.1 aminotransferase class I/II-fold pyridoxal phosphate-dependent enzyme [Hallerella sp.]PWL03844.1 aminotransferase [Hallerella porci]